MELQHRKLIKAYLPNLVGITYNVKSVANTLLDKTIINQWMYDSILDSSISESSKKERLYQIIQGRGPLAFSALCKVLEETKNINARKLLQISKNIINVDDIHITMKNVKLTDDEDEEPYVKVHPDRKRMDVDDDSTPTGVYPMGSNPKGNAFILNINKTVGRDDREGSDVDVVSLEKLFTSLGYLIQSEIDLTYEQTINAIKAFIEKCQHKTGNSVVIFIMSHGEAGKDSSRSSDILTTDGININTDWLVELIGSDETFKSIPKLFFIQACRGKNSDFGFVNTAHKNILQHDNTNTNNFSIGNLVNRRYENVFIAYATVPGYSAKRHPKNGSWFVQKLCQVVRNSSWQFDIDSIMRMVDVEIRSLNCLLYGFQTVEWTYRGFNKKFYFNPGLYDDDNSDGNTLKITSADPVNT